MTDYRRQRTDDRGQRVKNSELGMRPPARRAYAPEGMRNGRAANGKEQSPCELICFYLVTRNTQHEPGTCNKLLDYQKQ
jgi:hypothetical protein